MIVILETTLTTRLSTKTQIPTMENKQKTLIQRRKTKITRKRKRVGQEHTTDMEVDDNSDKNTNDLVEPKKTRKLKHFLLQVENKAKLSLKNTFQPLTDDSDEDSDADIERRRTKRTKNNPKKATETIEVLQAAQKDTPKGWGHATSNCGRPPQCLKCAGDHITRICTKTRDTANFTKCRHYTERLERLETKKALENKKYVAAPIPKENAWKRSHRLQAAGRGHVAERPKQRRIPTTTNPTAKGQATGKTTHH
ncbi:unnamed protein product [Psylliodes chrysocephalus]|uniref:Uncharacterized protein n=1 Tax=Psylliodes chrysocephalus TaxID=3402493 RepID=A0A9P0GI15_9CUCU|nr:unnamed protein product [Psylliodes chrysocephala]